ncbi:class I SAM-dependent methyltransferase [Baekduia soli]|uniref:class I SAM-dependent methyltransferase n=1 Tax=Baekduia soli TaxID=496014 RepID=UPI0016521216|nr:class I SAM-dependent methyltransferase [Baekduia soli]
MTTTAEYYDTYWSEGGAGYVGRESDAVAEVFARFASKGADTDVLDIGCGDGRVAGPYMQAHARSYVGVDVSAAAVERARSLGLDARVIEDAAVLPFASASFDLVLCFEVFEHLFRTEEAAAEILRVLRPGGHAVIQVPNAAHWRARADLALLGRFSPLGDQESGTRPWRDPHIRFFTLDSLAGLMRQVGLRVVERSGGGVTPLLDLPFLRDRVTDRAAGPVATALMRHRPELFANRIRVVVTHP